MGRGILRNKAEQRADDTINSWMRMLDPDFGVSRQRAKASLWLKGGPAKVDHATTQRQAILDDLVQQTQIDGRLFIYLVVKPYYVRYGGVAILEHHGKAHDTALLANQGTPEMAWPHHLRQGRQIVGTEHAKSDLGMVFNLSKEVAEALLLRPEILQRFHNRPIAFDGVAGLPRGLAVLGIQTIEIVRMRAPRWRGAQIHARFNSQTGKAPAKQGTSVVCAMSQEVLYDDEGGLPVCLLDALERVNRSRPERRRVFTCGKCYAVQSTGKGVPTE
jgi:hypothetical protein